MIGNDVIDLTQSRIESRWQRRGFTEKLFVPEEQQLIAEHHEPEIMVWLLWSMKEAAYKIYNRQTKIREYSPKKLLCSLHSLNAHNTFGKVVCAKNTYYTKTIISSESIHTIAVTVFEDLNNIMEIENKKIIKDENGIPYLVTSPTILKPVSVSHHGRFEKIITLSI
ncbi:4'-phosphopantetheinyl transferase superfamily protein [Flavobacterium sp. HTF]|uniref:4'-phosphopantetheinyl transferase family protein n=1 Tax=Flavobacterium sp. HTF TaxID=2170732 RepID=UPI000D5EA9D7|nr:4'-phosphopantetheinyl transferase superfamily protein [Flavobacterium sp. HTF]PWB27163.1 phosphopantetheinyl transferase [Flavobacterium sp. HTF]